MLKWGKLYIYTDKLGWKRQCHMISTEIRDITTIINGKIKMCVFKTLQSDTTNVAHYVNHKSCTNLCP